MSSTHAKRDATRRAVDVATGTRFCRRGNHFVKLANGPGKEYRDAAGNRAWCCGPCSTAQRGRMPPR